MRRATTRERRGKALALTEVLVLIGLVLASTGLVTLGYGWPTTLGIGLVSLTPPATAFFTWWQYQAADEYTRAQLLRAGSFTFLVLMVGLFLYGLFFAKLDLVLGAYGIFGLYIMGWLLFSFVNVWQVWRGRR